MDRNSKLIHSDFLAAVIGLLALFFGGLLIIKQNYLFGFILSILAIALLSYRTIFTINNNDLTLQVVKKCFFISLKPTIIEIKPTKGKIKIFNSSNETYGMNRKSSTFLIYDVAYLKENNHKIHILTTGSKDKANKLATFLSKNLNLPLEIKIIKR